MAGGRTLRIRNDGPISTVTIDGMDITRMVAHIDWVLDPGEPGVLTLELAPLFPPNRAMLSHDDGPRVMSSPPDPEG